MTTTFFPILFFTCNITYLLFKSVLDIFNLCYYYHLLLSILLLLLLLLLLVLFLTIISVLYLETSW